MTTGRTVAKHVKFQIEDTGGTLRDVPVNQIGGVGLTYEEIDLTAFQEVVKNFLPGQADFALDFGGPFDNTAAQAASGTGARPALSGSHTVLAGLNGEPTARAFGVYFGIQADWATGDPVFGASASAIITDYQVDPAGTYKAKLRFKSGGTAPGWGTAAITT